jgi:hypothetical protein
MTESALHRDDARPETLQLGPAQIPEPFAFPGNLIADLMTGDPPSLPFDVRADFSQPLNRV